MNNKNNTYKTKKNLLTAELMLTSEDKNKDAEVGGGGESLNAQQQKSRKIFGLQKAVEKWHHHVA